MKKIILILFTIHRSLFTLFQSEAQIIHVPADQPTIQAGINAANDGDTVLVADGTYLENINFMGKAITVASNFIIDMDTSHINSTIIDGSQNPDPGLGTVVTFDSNEDTTSCLYGFTVTGGSGTKVPYIFLVNTGGGILFLNAGGKLIHNIIRNNQCILDTLNGSVSGGGISSGPHGTNHMIVMRENIIRNNFIWTKGNTSSWDRGWAQGGGIYLCFNAIMEGNQVDSNICRSDYGISVGGGIRMIADQTDTIFQILVEIKNNSFRYNESISQTYGAFAGGISCSAANAIVENNQITSNKVESQNYCKGAGLYFDLINSYYANVKNNYIINNYCVGENTDGGAIGLYRSIEIDILNNVIENNLAANGGAFSINASQPRLISNNTILNNKATLNGGACYIYASSIVEILNSIMWNDTANELPNEIHVESGFVIVSYSDIQGGWIGQGNFSDNPDFLGYGSDPFELSFDSPCIDFGNPDTSGLNLPSCDIIGNYRVWDGNGDDIDIIDIGSYEYGSIPVSIKPPIVQSSSSSWRIKVQSYPNPFRDHTTIGFTLPEDCQVSLKVYDITGREIRLLVSGVMVSGEHTFTLQAGELQGGIYIYRLSAGDEVVAGKLVARR